LGSKNTLLATELLENVMIEDMAMLDVSSTNIRQRVKEWKSIKYLVPEPVEQFIHNQQLYL
jgi:nicotinate-nucleotide adenylyltransferase